MVTIRPEMDEAKGIYRVLLLVRAAFRALRSNLLMLTGSVMLAIVLAVAIFAPVLAPNDPYVTSSRLRLTDPSRDYPFGTDNFGRCTLSRLIYGARLSMSVGVAAVVGVMVLGVPYGLISGFFPHLDSIMMRVADAFMAFPTIILAIGIMAVLGSSATNVVIALVLVQWPRVARLIRSSVLQVRDIEYIEAVTSMGASTSRIIFRHILPNCMTPVIVQASFILALTILSETSLSFLGVGAPPHIPSWGNMLNLGSRFMRPAPWLAIYPGIAIMVTMLSANLLGDGLRDHLDPRMRGTK